MDGYPDWWNSIGSISLTNCIFFLRKLFEIKDLYIIQMEKEVWLPDKKNWKVKKEASMSLYAEIL